jgi:hypothetical protein
MHPATKQSRPAQRPGQGMRVAEQKLYDKLVGVFVSDIKVLTRGSREHRLEAIIQAAQRLRARKTNERISR